MTKISAKVIADSKNEFGNRITTMVVTFPRFILAELNTHRMMSRNSASSRAIPFKKMINSIENDPFVPIAFQKDHSGMQGAEYLEGVELEVALQAYGRSVEYAINRAKEFAATGVTKQLVNRQLEPFMWHTVIITATEWENFFALRCPKYELFPDPNSRDLGECEYFRSRKEWSKRHKECYGFTPKYDEIGWLKQNKGQAEIHMMELAEQMWDAMNESIPKELKAGEWHIPFGDDIDYMKAVDVSNQTKGTSMSTIDDKLVREVKIKIATARCARVSYTVVGEENKPANYEADIKLHDRLVESGHWSPFEHCAQAMSEADTKQNRIVIKGKNDSDNLGWSGNFKGFIQYRKTFNNENITK